MSTSRRWCPRPSRDDGFTLIELLVAIVVLGIIAAPLSAVVITYLRNTDSTNARMTESHDAQTAASYFAQDVQAVGMRGSYSAAAEPAFIPSIQLGATAGGALFPCGAVGTPAAVVSLGSDDFADANDESRFQRYVAYVVVGSELRRTVCTGSTSTSSSTIARDLVAPFATVSCTNAAGASMACSGATLPATVSMVLTIQNEDSGSDTPYEVTLTGQRRQT
jgi:prepilin-type N-terminal cleavage/methylation domain-containing protein